MRYSVRSEDPGYESYCRIADNGRRYPVVELDGQVVTDRCVTADTTKNEVVLFAENDDGCYIVEGDRLKTEVRRGQVTVTWFNRSPAA